MAGRASPTFKHGRYSQALPERLATRAEVALSDRRLLSLGDDIAVMQARLQELFERLETGESGALWGDVRQALDAFNAASLTGNTDAMQTTFTALQTLIQRGSSEAQTWQEIQRAWGTLCKLVATESKTLVALQQVVTVQQLMAYQSAITDCLVKAVQAHVDERTGRQILLALQADFTDLSLRGSRA